MRLLHGWYAFFALDTGAPLVQSAYMNTLHEMPNMKALLVMDGRRPLCKARYIPSMHGWQLKSYGFNWIDPRAREPNCFGHVNPYFMFIKTMREVRRIFNALCR